MDGWSPPLWPFWELKEAATVLVADSAQFIGCLVVIVLPLLLLL